MSKTRFSIGSHELQLVGDGFGKETIIYDNKIVSDKRNLGLSSTHNFKVNENGENVKYEVTFKANNIAGLLQYTVKRNNVLVKNGVFSPMTVGLLRILFFGIGLTLVGNLMILIFFPDFRDFIISKYTPSELTTFYINLGIEFIFGVLLLSFAFLLKRILVKLPKLIVIVLSIRIAIMTLASPFVFANLMEGSQSLPEKLFIIFFRIGVIWLFWFLLENCREMAKELKLEASLQGNH
ncbi:hypothetical protein FM036_41350 [Nostoc sp. HG1]|nr:hypothetical protein [Nostoc sp. HG1]